jgi:hypothetical protein
LAVLGSERFRRGVRSARWASSALARLGLSGVWVDPEHSGDCMAQVQLVDDDDEQQVLAGRGTWLAGPGRAGTGLGRGRGWGWG